LELHAMGKAGILRRDAVHDFATAFCFLREAVVGRQNA
jgi:hypothetical protein